MGEFRVEDPHLVHSRWGVVKIENGIGGRKIEISDKMAHWKSRGN